MDKVLQIISTYVSCCSNCRLAIEKRCGYIIPDNLPTPENNPYDSPEFCNLTYEQRAFRKESMVHVPCEEQMSFHELIDMVESALEQAEVPLISQDILRLLGKIDRAEKSIRRQPEHIFYAFEDIVMTCLERCLAHIDFTLLELKMDIEEAILSIFPSYNRMDSLCLSHPKPFVLNYLKHAVKISLSLMTACNSSLYDLRNEAVEQDEVQREYENAVEAGNVLPAPRSFSGSAIKELMFILSDKANNNIIRAIKKALSQPQLSRKAEDYIRSEMDEHFGYYGRWTPFTQELGEMISRNLLDYPQIDSNIITIINSAKGIAGYFKPQMDAPIDEKEFSMALSAMATVNVGSLDIFSSLWVEALNEARQRRDVESMSEDQYLDCLYRIACDKAQVEGAVNTHNVFYLISQIKENLEFLAIAIQGCFIERFVEKRYVDYERMTGIRLIDEISIVDYWRVFRWDLDKQQLYFSRKPDMPTDNEEDSVVSADVDSTDVVLTGEMKDADSSEDDSQSPHGITTFEMSPEMTELVAKVPNLIIDGIWQGTAIKEYAIFLKALSMKAFGLGKDENIRWKDLPISPMKDNKVVTINQLRNAMRRYVAVKDGGKLNTFLKALE